MNLGTQSKKYMTLAAASLIALAAACAADDAEHDPDPGEPGDGGAPEGAGPNDGNAVDVDLDAERSLACGATGFCETRLPTGEFGAPLSLRGVWMVDSNDIWSVTLEGSVLHYDGASWTKSYEASHALYSVWATATDVWVGGEGGLLFHRTVGGVWTHVETGHTTAIQGIYGSGSGDVWFTGRESSVDHFDGTTLKSHSLGVPGLRVTTVFGRAGLGAYAAGYVKGLSRTPAWLLDDAPYIFELSPTAISIFNSSLPEPKGFMPISGVVVDTPSEGAKILMVGFSDDGYSTRLRHFMVGKSTAATHDILMEISISNSTNPSPPVDRIPIWANRWDNVVVPYQIGAVFRWDGSSFKQTSLDMGLDFVPRTVSGMHGNSTETWIVGDGFALKGTMP